MSSLPQSLVLNMGACTATTRTVDLAGRLSGSSFVLPVRPQEGIDLPTQLAGRGGPANRRSHHRWVNGDLPSKSSGNYFRNERHNHHAGLRLISGRAYFNRLPEAHGRPIVPAFLSAPAQTRRCRVRPDLQITTPRRPGRRGARRARPRWSRAAAPAPRRGASAAAPGTRRGRARPRRPLPGCCRR